MGTRSHHTRLVFACLFLSLVSSAVCQPTEDSLENCIAQVSSENLKAHVTHLSGIGSRGRIIWCGSEHRYEMLNPEAQTKKIAYIKGQLESYGYEVELETIKVIGGQYPCTNIIATKRGLKNPDRVLELGAHYDTIDNPGADDNCSGVAGVLEVARIAAGKELENSLRFCVYDWEEVGGFGSRNHAEKIAAADEDFQGVYVFEMIGCCVEGENTQKIPVRIPFLCNPPTTGNFIAVVGDVQSAMLAAKYEYAIRKYVPQLKFFSAKGVGGAIGDASRSDHASYWRKGLKAVMLTDTANFRNPNYHSKSDTVDTLNFDFMTNVVKAMTATLLEYAVIVQDK